MQRDEFRQIASGDVLRAPDGALWRVLRGQATSADGGLWELQSLQAGAGPPPRMVLVPETCAGWSRVTDDACEA